MYLIGAVLTGLFGFAYFGRLNTAAPALIFIAIVLSFVPHDLMYGPQAALIAECFTRGYGTAAARSAISSPRSSRAGWRH